MTRQMSGVPDSPFWNPDDVTSKEFEEWISDPAYFREFTKGLAEQLTHDDWARIYRTIKKGIGAFLTAKGLNVNSQVGSFRLGLIVGKAMHDEWFKK